MSGLGYTKVYKHTHISILMGGKGSGISQEKERIFRTNELWQMILNNEGKTKNEIVAKFQFRFGTSRRTTLDYLKILILNGKIMERDKRLFRWQI